MIKPYSLTPLGENEEGCLDYANALRAIAVTRARPGETQMELPI